MTIVNINSGSEAAPGMEQWAPCSVPGARWRDMRSSLGRNYRISVYVPAEEPPAAGFPVIYALDGNAVFATAVDAIRIQGRRPEKTGVSPAIVIGIGYPADGPFAPGRFYDYTPSGSTWEAPPRTDEAEPPKLGGADAFLDFIELELKPLIERDCPIDPAKQTIFGHSLGGLCVLHALFSRPQSFRTYVAGSPSIHWNKQPLLEKERQFASRLEQERADTDITVLIAAGELETNHRMVENAAEQAERLSGLAERGVDTLFKVFEDEGHVSVLPALISRLLRYAT